MYWKLQNGINPPYVPFFRIILEAIAFEGTSPEEPTLTTRTYQAQVMDNRIVGQGTGTQPQVSKLIGLVISAKDGDYPQPKVRVLDQFLEKPRLENDRCYMRSRQIQPRPADVVDNHPEAEGGWGGYLPIVVAGVAVAIGAGIYFFKAQDRSSEGDGIQLPQFARK